LGRLLEKKQIPSWTRWEIQQRVVASRQGAYQAHPAENCSPHDVETNAKTTE
jgi:hypothetical protein